MVATEKQIGESAPPKDDFVESHHRAYGGALKSMGHIATL